MNVGGGSETPQFSSLNPINPNSGGPTCQGVSNLGIGFARDIARFYLPNSAKNIMSSKLLSNDVV